MSAKAGRRFNDDGMRETSCRGKTITSSRKPAILKPENHAPACKAPPRLLRTLDLQQLWLGRSQHISSSNTPHAPWDLGQKSGPRPRLDTHHPVVLHAVLENKLHISLKRAVVSVSARAFTTQSPEDSPEIHRVLNDLRASRARRIRGPQCLKSRGQKASLRCSQQRETPRPG